MPPLLLKSSDAARVCGVSLRLWRTWNTLGKNPAPLRVGPTLFWKHEELARWVEAGCPTRQRWNALCEKSEKKTGATDSKSRK